MNEQNEDIGYNKEKMMREVYCSNCRIYSFSDNSNPKCYTCQSNLITVVRDIISGQRVTGNHGI